MEGVIFDFNGTLIFDDKINIEAWLEYSKRIKPDHIPMTLEEYFSLNGQPGDHWIKYLLGPSTPDSTCRTLSDEKEDLYREFLLKSDIELAEGATELFDDLKKNNVPYTIATSSIKANVDAYIKKFNLEKYFDVSKIVYFDGTFRGKPNPDIYQIAAKKLGVDITKCIVFEDTRSGVKSGSCAGAKVIGMASGKPVDVVKKYDTVVDVVVNYKGLDTEKLKKYFE